MIEELVKDGMEDKDRKVVGYKEVDKRKNFRVNSIERLAD